MVKRIISILLILCLLFTFCACGSTSSIVTLDDAKETIEDSVSPNNLSIFSTRDVKEYLEFLTTFDFKNYEIIDISTGMISYACGESYIVTYAKRDSDKDDDKYDKINYKYYLYKTRSQEEYLSFYSTLDLEIYEIVDISTRLTTYSCGESYMITYREAI